jgi:hypothetical protein
MQAYPQMRGTRKKQRDMQHSFSFEILPEPEISKTPENQGMMKKWIKKAKKTT